MRFRIEEFSHPGPKLGRILNALARNAQETLTEFAKDPADRIHTLRTDMKKIRSVWELAKAELPSARWAKIQNEVSYIKSAYGSVRDQAVLAELFDRLIQADEVPELRQLFNPPARVIEMPADDLLEAANRLVANFSTLPFWAVTGTGVERAFKKSVHRAKAAGRRCKPDSSDEKFHEWRKRIKALSIQAKILDSKFAKPASRLAEDLGKVNDLANLRRRLDLEILPNALHDRIERKLAEARQKALHRARKFDLV